MERTLPRVRDLMNERSLAVSTEHHLPSLQRYQPHGLVQNRDLEAIRRLDNQICKIDGMPMVGTHLTGWNKNVKKSDIIIFKYLEMERRTLHRHHDRISCSGGKPGS